MTRPLQPTCRTRRSAASTSAASGALGRFATGVVVMSAGSGERLHAMTANAFMSSSLKPPLIVVSVGHIVPACTIG